MKVIDIAFNFITGMMVGAEYVEEDGDKCIVIDLFIIRFLIVWGDE